MFVKNVYAFGNFPVEESQRKWTDCICTIIAAIFALTLFILACCSFTRSTLPPIQPTTTKPTSPSIQKASYATTNSQTPPTCISPTSTISNPVDTALHLVPVTVPSSPAQ